MTGNAPQAVHASSKTGVLISQLSRLPQLSDVQACLMVNFNRQF